MRLERNFNLTCHVIDDIACYWSKDVIYMNNIFTRFIYNQRTSQQRSNTLYNFSNAAT